MNYLIDSQFKSRPFLKVLLVAIFIVLGTCGCTKKSSDVPTTAPSELSFRLSPSFKDATLIVLPRSTDGNVVCTVHAGPEEADVPPATLWRQVKELPVPALEFSALSSAFEDPQFVQAAELGRKRGADGTDWIFRKQVGSRTIMYDFWSPESYPSEASERVIALGRRFAVLAQMEPWFEPHATAAN